MKLIAIINAVSRLFSVLMVFALVHSENHLYLYCICYAITFLLSAASGNPAGTKKIWPKSKALQDCRCYQRNQRWLVFVYFAGYVQNF